MADTDDPFGTRTDALLSKADALLARHRSARAATVSQPPEDYPVLVDVVEPPPPEAAARTPGEATPSELQLAALEQELRLQLLQQIGPELERLVEARVNARLEPQVAEIMINARRELETAVRRAVREALSEAIEGETARLLALRERGAASDFE